MKNESRAKWASLCAVLWVTGCSGAGPEPRPGGVAPAERTAKGAEAITLGCQTATTTRFVGGPTVNYGTFGSPRIVTSSAYGSGGYGMASAIAMLPDPPAQQNSPPQVPPLTVPTVYAFVDAEVLQASQSGGGTASLQLTVTNAAGVQMCPTTSTPVNGANTSVFLQCQFSMRPQDLPLSFDVQLTTTAPGLFDAASATVEVQDANLKSCGAVMRRIEDLQSLEVGTPRCLESLGADPNDESDNGQPVDESNCSGGSNQEWQFDSDGSLRNVEGMCLDIPDTGGGQPPGGVNNSPVQIFSCHPGVNQQWSRVAVGGAWQIKSQMTDGTASQNNVCLTSQPGNGNRTTVTTCVPTPNVPPQQLWVINN